jgi:hypothetical protein
MRSEFIFFTKCKENKAFFSLAKKIYDKPKTFLEQIGGQTPDEYGFNIAGCILKHYPHRDNYSPVYWEYLHGKLRLQKGNIHSNYFAYSIGGMQCSDRQKEHYNSLANAYYRHLGLSFPYKVKDKRKYLAERQKL